MEFLKGMEPKNWIYIAMLVCVIVGWSTLVTLSSTINKQFSAARKVDKKASNKLSALGTSAVVFLSIYIAYRLFEDALTLEMVKENSLVKSLGLA